MTAITYLKLSNKNLVPHSLDEFVRHQEIKECWRNTDGKLVLVKNEYTEDWDLCKRREIVQTLINGIKKDGFGYGAFCQNKLIGYIYLSKKRFGSKNQYIELQLFHISEPFRRIGIGKELFRLACAEAKALKVQKIYISAHSSKESQAAYRMMGCVDAEEINTKIAENEPFDIQMEYKL